MKSLRCGARLLIILPALVLAGGAGAQENLDQGKSAAQLFASDCALCHKSPQGLAKSGGLFGLENFLREHYTASRETAKAIATYLKSMDSGPAAPARTGKRGAKGNEKAKAGEKKNLEAKPGEKDTGVNPGDRGAGGPKSSDSKPADSKPSDILAPEPKAVDSKPQAPAAGDPKPAETVKPAKADKSD
jgi:hypothetical protein